MKILFFGTRMDLISGHSRPAFELASALIDRGHEVRIVSTSLSAERASRHEAAMARSPQLARTPVLRPFADLREMVRHRRRSVTVLQPLLADCDLLHGFSFNATRILSGLLPLRVPLVLSLCTDIRPSIKDCIRVLSQAPFYLRQPGFTSVMLTPRFILRRGLSRFDRIISWSRHIQRRLRDIGIPETRISSIPLGMDKGRVDWPERPSILGSPVFLYAGLLSTLRGIPTLIRAFSEVIRVAPQARLVIADRGPHTSGDVLVQTREDRMLARMIASFGLEGSILVRGYEEHLTSWFNASDAVVLPFSTTIGYAHPPATLLEAMAHAKPVITSRIGSAPEYIEHGLTGMLTDPGDAAGLGRAMVSLDPEAAQRMGREARKHAEAQPDWSEVAVMTEAVYADLILSSHPPA